MSGPNKRRIRQASEGNNLGGSTEAAWENMVDRIGSDDVELMVTAVLIQRQIGGKSG
jgi:tight adherence protein B